MIKGKEFELRAEGEKEEDAGYRIQDAGWEFILNIRYPASSILNPGSGILNPVSSSQKIITLQL
jgi:hypothetical protein